MANELMPIFESPVSLESSDMGLRNYKLRQHTAAIIKLMNATKRNLYEIAARLVVIRDEKLYEDDGFESVHDYASKCFGYKQNMTYKMLVTAEKFIEKAPDNKRYISIMAHEDNDYTVSQLIELNSLEAETAQRLDKSGTIDPTMTTKQIREVVKSYKSGDIDADGNGGENEESDGGESDTSDDAAKAIKAAIKALEKLSETSALNDEQMEQVDTLKAMLSVRLANNERG